MAGLLPDLGKLSRLAEGIGRVSRFVFAGSAPQSTGSTPGERRLHRDPAHHLTKGVPAVFINSVRRHPFLTSLFSMFLLLVSTAAAAQITVAGVLDGGKNAGASV